MKKTLLYFLTLMLFYSCGNDENKTTAFEAKHMRGINITCADETVLSKSDFLTWKAWNINAVRINFNKDDQSNAFTNEPSSNVWSPYVKNKEKLTQWLQWCKEANIQVIIALDMLWGDYHYSDSVWTNNGDNKYLQHRIQLCGEIESLAKQYANVLYIEPWNEPYPYNDLYKTHFLPEVLSIIESRKSAIKLMCMAPANWGNKEGFDNWNGLNSDKVVLQHTYISTVVIYPPTDLWKSCRYFWMARLA